MSRRPRALLVSPILPATGGNGLAMRAGVFLEALAVEHEVTLLVVPVAGAPAGGEPPDFVLSRVRRWAVLPLGDALDPLFSLSAGLRDPAARLAALRDYPRPRLCRWATGPALAKALAAARDARDADDAGEDGEDGAARFDAVLVLRSYLAPYAAPFLTGEGGKQARRVLDLDDDEQVSQNRLSELFDRRGQREEALLAAAEAGKYAAHERLWLPRFDLVLATSEAHAAAVRERHPGVEVTIVPNTVEVPGGVRRGRRGRRAHRARAPRLLFVGNLGYEPNVEAALWLGREIVPRLWAQGWPAELRIAGSRPAAAVAALAGPGIEVCADPVDLAPLYAWADVAVAPILAGGGTRIKILEAFAARVPVVATPLGAEGLAVRDGEHLLLAEDSDTLAAACRRLGESPLLGRHLAANALRLVRRRYLRSAGLRQIRGLLTDAAERV
jgi:glycosyltransferase involved in cell wall biosynthesis